LAAPPDEHEHVRAQLSHPAGGHVGFTCLFLNISDGFLVLLNFFPDSIELSQRLLTVGRNCRLLLRVIPRNEVSRQRIDTALERLLKDLRAREG
jgi:hypothetical protein